MMYYNKTDICDRIKEDGIKCAEDFHGKAYKEKDIKGNWTGNWICRNCYNLKRRKKHEIVERRYNSTNICDNIENGIKCENILVPGKAYKKYNNGIWTKKWLCKNCHGRREDKINPDTRNNILKSMSDRRTNNIKENNNWKGDLFEELTHRWKGVKILSIENDCYNGPLDHSCDSEGKIYQTMGRSGTVCYDAEVHCFTFEREWKKNFDFEICYCTSNDEKIIEKMYIFPKEEIVGRTSVTIYKNPSKRIGWYEKYRFKDEEELRKVNEIWKQILEEK